MVYRLKRCFLSDIEIDFGFDLFNDVQIFFWTSASFTSPLKPNYALGFMKGVGNKRKSVYLENKVWPQDAEVRYSKQRLDFLANSGWN
ncbi:hypothetical protein P872_15385 [Rhodonellum psychrophilum GCM71 = DSM 17998]|uniref:Uncharacterized protein n=2 Tax=Rhodonellum TaxID=336827 RepID=U5C2X2_9BACT|nr:hypothetical protein P872_15385 [Rhodonellum psychrophilum GCM71 = DSM 17998]SDZ19853.1 hypothetical protein SAMN05444412_107149 [Rhodonellum ikkaensis]